MRKLQLTSLFQSRPITYHECNKNELAQMFCDAINPGRVAIGLKPYTVPRINMLLQHLDLADRKLLYGSCLGAANFSSCFHYSIKPR